MAYLRGEDPPDVWGALARLEEKTNDLTQTALGFSRDDAEGKILARYIDRGIVDRSPFDTLDTVGVGWLVRRAAAISVVCAGEDGPGA